MHRPPSTNPTNHTMNSSHTPTLVFFAALSAVVISSAIAAPPDRASAGFTVRSIVTSQGETLLQRGDSETEVLRLLGSSYARLSPNVWLYHGLHGTAEPADGLGCNGLLVVFRDGHIVDMKLINRPAQKLVAARLKTDPASVGSLFVGESDRAFVVGK
jgi:hypothetical protein